MNKITKKLGVIAASIALIASMTAVSFAANPSLDSTISIEKNLVVTNPTLTSVDGPGLSYTYTVSPETPAAANGGTTITDTATPTAHTGNVYVGVAGGLTLSDEGTVSWPKGTAVTASSTGADNAKSITATATANSFPRPGIYRYKIQEAATPATPSSIGVTDANAAEVRYIDVYVENDTSGLKIAGLVMHDGTTENGAPKAANKKSFDASQFDTKNIEVKKATTGNMADKNHQFSFSAAVSDNGRTYYDGKGATAAAATNSNATGTSTTTLADGESFWICGVSTVGTVNVTETNNSNDTYTTSVSGLATVAGSAVAPSGTIASGNVTTSDNGTILFTNNLDSVSPTGVIMRFGPYFGMVVVAALLFMMKRRAQSK